MLSASLTSSRRLATTFPLLALACAWAATAGVAERVHAYTGDVVLAPDANVAANIFETTITADETTLDLTNGVAPGNAAEVMAYNGTIPGPEIRANVDDVVIIHFINNLEVPSSIHAHGIELHNAHDGTAVTQNEVPPGGTFDYMFQVPRAGVFWYHPHITPTVQDFKGLYGTIIIGDGKDTTLAGLGVLPDAANTKTLVLSDVVVCDGAGGPVWSPPRDPCGALGVGEIPNPQPAFDCRAGGGGACRVDPAPTVLSNGEEIEAGDILDITNGDAVRLQILNSAITRYFRLVATGPDPNNPFPFYRIGGEAGLLDAVRIEGGMPGGYDTLFDSGELVLAPADRDDVVLVPMGADGDIITIDTIAATRGNNNPPPPTAPVMRIRLNGPPPAMYFPIAAGDPLLTHPAINMPLEDLGAIAELDQLIDPTTLPSAPPGSPNPLIQFLGPVMGACQSADDCHAGACEDNTATACPPSTDISCVCVNDDSGPAINGVINGMEVPIRGMFDEAVPGLDFTEIPYIPSTRYARVHDLLELRISNVTGSHHPFHLHGFSIQPIRIEDNAGATLFTYNHVEYLDNINIINGQTLVFRVRLEDRPSLEDLLAGSGLGSGGAAGRWVFHCHIFHHAGLGMISELVVLPDLNHFLCYEVRRRPGYPGLRGLSLEDQFGMSTGDLRRRKRLCNPVNKNDEDASAVTDPGHLVSYELRQTDPQFLGVDDVTIVNQFGEFQVDVSRPERLLVPSGKVLAADLDPNDPPVFDPIGMDPLDHFKCYRIRRARTRVPDLSLEDQFGELVGDVKRPRNLCVPVDKNGEGIFDAEAHLTCYKIRTRPRRHQSGVPYFVNNQLEQENVVITGPRELCVPSLKILPQPTATPPTPTPVTTPTQTPPTPTRTPVPTSTPMACSMIASGQCGGVCPNRSDICGLNQQQNCVCIPRATVTPTPTPTGPTPTPTPMPCGLVQASVCAGTCPNPSDVCQISGSTCFCGPIIP